MLIWSFTESNEAFEMAYIFYIIVCWFCLLYRYFPIVCLLFTRRFQNFICYSYCLVNSIFLFVFFLFLQRDICAIKLKLKTVLKTDNGSQKRRNKRSAYFFLSCIAFFLLLPLFLSFFTCFIRIIWKIWFSQWNSKFVLHGTKMFDCRTKKKMSQYLLTINHSFVTAIKRYISNTCPFNITIQKKQQQQQSLFKF